MNVAAIRALETLLLPPGSLILLGLMGLLLWRRRLGRTCIFLALLGLYLLSAPAITARLAAGLEVYPALSPDQARATGAEAIVVLGGGRYSDAPEYGGDTVGHLFLERIRYAAWLARQTGLGVIPSGGSPLDEGEPEARLAEQTIREEFGVEVLALEDQSRTTWENAQFTREVLDQADIGRVLLITHAIHMPRALEVFQRAGVDAVPAPTAFINREGGEAKLSDWLPSARSLYLSQMALHEYVGQIWYRLRS